MRISTSQEPQSSVSNAYDHICHLAYLQAPFDQQMNTAATALLFEFPIAHATDMRTLPTNPAMTHLLMMLMIVSSIGANCRSL